MKTFNEEEREKLLEEMAKLEEFREDLIDIATILMRQSEESRPYEEFVEELK
ncbi:MAG: hypothetical protein ACUVXI_17175 [bacterium]